jgi:signal peptidase
MPRDRVTRPRGHTSQTAMPLLQPLRLARRLAGGLVFAAGLLLAALMLLPAVAGLQRYVITSGSMTGTYDVGSIVYARAVPVEHLRVGDVITYGPPPGASPTPLVTHRIVSITRSRGTRVFTTKGDANPSRDPWRFSLSAPRQARVSFGVPYAGYAFAALSDRRARMLLIGLPALLIALGSLAGVWRDLRRALRPRDAVQA